MSSTHSTSIWRERRRNSCASLALTVKMVLPRSVAALRPGDVAALLHLAQPARGLAMPELASITFFRSGGSELYLALFIAITKVVV